MNAHTQTNSRDPWDIGVRAADVPVIKPVSLELVFPLDPLAEWPAPDAPMVEFALYYARLGWHVFPCGRKAPLTACDKDADGKRSAALAVSIRRARTKIRFVHGSRSGRSQ